MKILFAIALPIEMKTIKSQIKNLNLNGCTIDFLLTWVWVINSVYHIKNYIQEKQKPDFLVNIWVCGKKDEKYNDFFQVYRIKNLSNNKEILCPNYIDFLKLESIGCSDKIITDICELGEESLVDMESYGIDYIAEKEKIPYIMIKKPFDTISSGSRNVTISDIEKILNGCDLKLLFEKIQDFHTKKSSKNYDHELQILKEKHRLTFSESQLLKKFFNKELAHGKKDTDITNILENASKKEILVYLQS